MIRTPEQLRQEVAREAEEFAAFIAESGRESSGIRKPPSVEASEVVLDTSPFNVGLDAESSSRVEGGGGGGGGGTDPVGACCYEDGDCEEIGELLCGDNGGDYQGNGITCEEADCLVHMGACCPTLGDCFITTPSICTGTGGVYQGDDTVCDPDPCGMPECSCGFDAFDGSGRKFLTRTTTASGSVHYTCAPGITGGGTDGSWDSTKTETIDPNICETFCTCSGSGSYNVDCDEPPYPCGGSMTAAGCSGGGDPGCAQSILIDSSDCGWSVGGCLTPAGFACFSCSPTGGMISATTEQFTWGCVVGSQNVSATQTTVLSDECTPI